MPIERRKVQNDKIIEALFVNHQGVQASQRKGLTSGEVQELPGKVGKIFRESMGKSGA